jgi:hypothetical protein
MTKPRIGVARLVFAVPSFTGFVLIALVSRTYAITPDNPGPASIQLTIDSGQNVKAISPWIYGTNFGWVSNAKFNRSGGNRLTGYNWENNASNAGSDWYHHSDFGMASGPNDPPGSAVRGMIQSAAANGQAVLVTVPMAGYVAADGNGTVDETEIAPSPRWKQVVPKKSTIYPGSPLSTNPNKTDGYVFTDEFVNWAENFKNPSQPVFYCLDRTTLSTVPTSRSGKRTLAAPNQAAAAEASQQTPRNHRL